MRSRVPFALIPLVALLLSSVASPLPAAEPPAEKPKLVVLVVVDSLRLEALTENRNYFGSGGFKRLLAEGSEFQGSFFPYANAKTAPGHATIATGTWPRVHGIIGNAWLDPKDGTLVTAIDETAGADPLSRLRGKTLADHVAEAGGKVVALSTKDAALFLGGRKPTASVWFRGDSGEMVGRSATGAAPDWVTDWNGGWRRFAKWDGKKWEPLPLTSTAPAREPNDFPNEAPSAFGTKFPHPMAEFDKKDPKPFWWTFDHSPFTGELLVELAETALAKEKLGADAKVDLLALSLPAADKVGHLFGPESEEYRDTVLRLDQQLEKLFTAVDKAVGKENWVVCVTADHGLANVPEVVTRRGGDAGRIDDAAVARRLEKYLAEALAAEGLPPAKLLRRKGTDRLGLISQNVYLDPATVAPENVEKVRDAAARVLRSFPEVRQAYTREQLATKDVFPFIRSLRFQYDPDRSGDVLFVWRMNWIDELKGAEHGSPDANDAMVPLLFSGTGVRKGTFRTRSTPADILPTLLSLAGLPVPEKGLSGRVLPVVPKPASGPAVAEPVDEGDAGAGPSN